MLATGGYGRLLFLPRYGVVLAYPRHRSSLAEGCTVRVRLNPESGCLTQLYIYITLHYTAFHHIMLHYMRVRLCVCTFVCVCVSVCLCAHIVGSSS